MACRKRRYQRLFVFEQVRRPHYGARHFATIKELRSQIRFESESGLSSLFPSPFAKNFLEKYNDISLLADLMGHESIETTRIYLRKTASEQQEIVDKVVTW